MKPDRLEATTAHQRTGGWALLRRHFARWLPTYLAVAALPFIIGTWYLLSDTGFVHRILLPPPGPVAIAFIELIGSPDFSRHLLRTASEFAIGFAAGVTIGFCLGLVLSVFAFLRKAYFSLIAGFDAIPSIVLAPLIITWFGFGIESKVVQAAIVCFFSVFITTLAGLAMTSEDEIRLMRVLRASRWQAFTKMRLPNALPAIFGGLKIAVTLALVGAVVSEFVAADAGLGFLMMQYRARFDTATVFGLIAIFAAIGMMGFLLIERIERYVVFWRHGSRSG